MLEKIKNFINQKIVINQFRIASIIAAILGIITILTAFALKITLLIILSGFITILAYILIILYINKEAEESANYVYNEYLEIKNLTFEEVIKKDDFIKGFRSLEMIRDVVDKYEKK